MNKNSRKVSERALKVKSLFSEKIERDRQLDRLTEYRIILSNLLIELN